MKYALGSLLFAGALALSFGAARADVLVLTSSALKDNDQLAVKNACADKQRSPNCVGENISPPLAWSGAPEGTKSFAIVMLDPEGRAPAGVVHMVIYGIPGDRVARPRPVGDDSHLWPDRQHSALAFDHDIAGIGCGRRSPINSPL